MRKAPMLPEAYAERARRLTEAKARAAPDQR